VTLRKLRRIVSESHCGGDEANHAGLAHVAEASYFCCMGVSLATRLVCVLTAIVFVLVTILPASAAMMPMPNGAGMASGTDQPCDDCPAKVPASNDTAKMGCGALACFGVVMAVMTRQALHLPAGMAADYPPTMLLSLCGASPAPDPFPPRSTVLI
jgi:hypothetical protein